MRIGTDAIRVLHVDDEPGFADVASEFLERADDRIEVTTAHDAEEGLEALESGSFDCVVSDYDMPIVDGLEFLEQIRANYGEIPFVLYTGKGSEEVASEAISAGVTDYLQKGGGTDQYTVLANRVVNAVEGDRSRRALERSRNRLSSLFEQSPLAAIEWNEEFEVVRWNDRAEEVFGYTAEEARGRKIPFIVPDRELDDVERVMEQLLDQSGGFYGINENVRKDGEVITCEWHNRVVTDDAGEVQSVISQAQDVTEREERKRRLETLVDTLPGIVYRALNEPDWPIEYAGGECGRLTGYTAEQIERGEVSWGEEVIHPEDRERVWQLVQESLDDGEPFELTYRIHTADGEVRRLWERGQGIYSSEGELEALEGFITEVSRRSERVERLELLAERMDRALRGTDTAIWEWEVETDRVFRHGVDDVLGVDDGMGDSVESFFERIHPDDRDRVRETYESAARDLERYRIQFRVRTDDGEVRWIEDRGEGWSADPEGTVRMTGCLTEVTDRREREDALRFRESLQAAQTRASREGIVVVDEDGEVVSCNDRFRELWGVPEETMEEGIRAVVDHVADSVVDPDGFREQSEHVVTDPATPAEQGPELVEHTDGRWIEHYSGPIEDGDSGLLGRVWFHRDVTEYHAHQRVLEELHETTRTLMGVQSKEEVAAVVVEAFRSILDLPINTCWLYEADDDLLRPVAWTDEATELGAIPTYERGEGISWRVFESGEPATFDDVSADADAYDPDTSIRSEMILPLGEHGVVNVGSTERGAFDEEDISLAKVLAANAEAAMDRADREAELRYQRQFVDQTVNALDDVFYVFDTDGEPIHWNDAVREVTGYDDDEIASMTAMDFFQGEDRERIAEAIQEIRETGNVTVTADLVTKEGDRIPYELTGAMLTDPDGDPIGFAGVGRDISERRERERELERKNERLEEFTRMVSHDIRSPLEVAQGHAELARAERDSDHLDDLVATHERMADLVDDLLTLAKADAALDDLERVSLPEVARSCWEGIRSEDATLRVETDRTIDADRRALERILTNLFVNAVEHGASGDDPSDLTVTVGDLDGGYYVADDGVGIDAELRDSVFERGYTTADAGPGFGLDIVQRLVEAHGWSIAATESQSGGARFEVHIPDDGSRDE